MGAINSIESKDRLAPALADEAFANCRASRDVLLADVLKFRRIGHPSEPEANSMVTDRQSLLNLDADLPENVLAVPTKRKLAEQKARKSVVSGTRVSVSVDLEGRRSSQKHTETETQ